MNQQQESMNQQQERMDQRQKSMDRKQDSILEILKSKPHTFADTLSIASSVASCNIAEGSLTTVINDEGTTATIGEYKRDDSKMSTAGSGSSGENDKWTFTTINS